MASSALFLFAVSSSLLLWLGTMNSWGIAAIGEAIEEGRYATSERDCVWTEFLSDKRCWWGIDAGGVPIYVLGDSTANMLSDGLVLAAAQLNRPLALAGFGGCPAFSVGGESEVCLDFRQKNQDWIMRQIPGTVVLTFSSQYFVDYESLENGGSNLGSLRILVSELVMVGHRVVVVLPPPRFEGPDYFFDPKTCTTWDWVSDWCRVEAPRDFFRLAQGPLREEIALSLADFDVRLIDLNDQICSATVCGSHDGGRLVYADTVHISKSTSIGLATRLSDSLR